MRLNAEKIGILKELYFGPQTIGGLWSKMEINWNHLSNLLQWLNKHELIKSIDEYRPTKWQIASAGIDAIKKWDQAGIQRELFQEKK